MLFVAFRSKLAGLCVIMGVLAVLTSALPTPPGDKQTQGEPTGVSFDVLIVWPKPKDSIHLNGQYSVSFRQNKRDGTTYFRYRSISVYLPPGRSPSEIDDPCAAGIAKLDEIDSLTSGIVAANVGKLYITKSQLERLLNGILEPDLPAYFEGGDDQAFVDHAMDRITKHEGFKENKSGIKQYEEHKEKNAGYRERLRKEKFTDKLSPEQKEQLARNPKASVC
ncbi:hypothetical protein C8R42DRAFT_404976 [Lentinula raphanica]|nr:hypothetical protein C8R42DRAFT_404976 [Lentinula raphanica]